MEIPREKKEKMASFTASLIKEIQHINGDPSKSPEEKKKDISELKGAPKEQMLQFVQDNFSNGLAVAKPRKQKSLKTKLGL